MARRAEPPRIRKESNGTYYVRWHDGSRSRKASLATADDAEAQRRFAIWLADEGADDPDAYTIDELLTFYEDEHLPTLADQVRAVQRLAHVRRHFGPLAPTDLKPRVVADYTRSRPVAPSTARGELQMLVAALNHNKRAGRISQTPYVALPPAGEPRDRFLSRVEIERLLNEARQTRGADGRMSRVERFVWLALECAQRRRAIEVLTWDQVDLEHGEIDFRIPGKRRTKKRQAVVPVSDRLQPMLARMHQERTSGCVLDHTGSIRTTFETLVNKAGMPDVTPHVLRHSAATHMARSGVPLWLVAGVLGNSVQMVEKTYAHHCPDGLRSAVNHGR
jgi:integrase